MDGKEIVLLFRLITAGFLPRAGHQQNSPAEKEVITGWIHSAIAQSKVWRKSSGQVLGGEVPGNMMHWSDKQLATSLLSGNPFTQIQCKFVQVDGRGQNTDPQSMDYLNGLPKWTTPESHLKGEKRLFEARHIIVLTIPYAFALETFHTCDPLVSLHNPNPNPSNSCFSPFKWLSGVVHLGNPFRQSMDWGSVFCPLPKSMQVWVSQWPNGMQVRASFKTCTDLHPVWLQLKGDKCQISPAASAEMVHCTVWRTWLFIAYSDEKWF